MGKTAELILAAIRSMTFKRMAQWSVLRTLCSQCHRHQAVIRGLPLVAIGLLSIDLTRPPPEHHVKRIEISVYDD